MEKLYLKIIETFKSQKVKTSFTESEIKPIQFIDLYYGQYLDPAPHEVYSRPALFFSWDIQHSQNPAETSKAIVRIHLVVENLRDTSSKSPKLERSLDFFDYIRETKKAIAPLKTEDTGTLRGIDEGLLEQPTVDMVYILSYECNYSGGKTFHADNYDYTEGDGEVKMDGFTKALFNQ